jgi:hypothetical protein
MPIDLQNQSNFSFKDMPKPQKTAVILLSLLAVFILIFWLWQFQAKLKSPFNPPEGYDKNASSSDLSASIIDTDQDGLTDEQEEMYGTSPYIEDTDSDGISDGEEISRGTDPSCAEGKSCFRSEDLDISNINSSSSTEADAASDQSDDELSVEEAAALEKLISGQGDASLIREFLLRNGASEEDLAGISDEDLLSSYQGVVEENNLSNE